MKPVTYIHYAFSSDELPLAVAEKHASFATSALAEHFKLPLSEVHVKHAARLPEDAAHQLSCYVGKSETCPVAMVTAARLVLPHLRNARKLLCLPCGPEYIVDDNFIELVAAPSLAGWKPGENIMLDDCALGLLATGARLPDTGLVAWLRTQALSAALPREKLTRLSGGKFAPANRTAPALDIKNLSISQLAAALLEHRRAEVSRLLAKRA